ncbi:hypothetical protein V5799_005515 [Amblyomma americanum]|uniref:Uncharacterized protein n=1 Tax=Amblyomma americanum TaxID=6943 RepID=A0AAQ4DZ16_AMBAM
MHRQLHPSLRVAFVTHPGSRSHSTPSAIWMRHPATCQRTSVIWMAAWVPVTRPRTLPSHFMWLRLSAVSLTLAGCKDDPDVPAILEAAWVGFLVLNLPCKRRRWADCRRG